MPALSASSYCSSLEIPLVIGAAVRVTRGQLSVGILGRVEMLSGGHCALATVMHRVSLPRVIKVNKGCFYIWPGWSVSMNDRLDKIKHDLGLIQVSKPVPGKPVCGRERLINK